MKIVMKKLFLIICCISLHVVSSVNASSQADNESDMITHRAAAYLLAAGACVFLYQMTPPLKTVHVCNESGKLIYIRSGFFEKLVGPDKQVTLTHRFLPLEQICASENDIDKKCTTDKSAVYDGIKTWYVDKNLVFTPDFAYQPHDKVRQVIIETLDDDPMQYRSYEAENKHAYIDVHTNNLRGSLQGITGMCPRHKIK